MKSFDERSGQWTAHRRPTVILHSGLKTQDQMAGCCDCPPTTCGQIASQAETLILAISYLGGQCSHINIASCAPLPDAAHCNGIAGIQSVQGVSGTVQGSPQECRPLEDHIQRSGHEVCTRVRPFQTVVCTVGEHWQCPRGR